MHFGGLWQGANVGNTRNIGHPKISRARYDKNVEPITDQASMAPNRDLRGRSLAGQNLCSRDLRSADLVACNLEAANLSECELTGASMHNARMRRATLTSAILERVEARDIDLENADLVGAIMRDSDFRSAIFLEADLRNADLTGANLRGADLRGANLTGAILDGACLDGADLAGAQLDGISMVNMSAKAARIRAVDGTALADRLRTAGAQSRPPLAIGKWSVSIVMLTSSVAHLLGRIALHAWRGTHPVRRVLHPFVHPIATQLRKSLFIGKQASGAVLRAPGGLMRFLSTRSARLTDIVGEQASRSKDLAGQMRVDVQTRLRQAALNRETRNRLKLERIERQRAERAARAQIQRSLVCQNTISRIRK